MKDFRFFSLNDMKQVCGSSKLVIAPPYGGLGQRRTICISSVAPNIKRRWVHTEANELLLAVAPYVPQIAEQLVSTVSPSIPQFTETATSHVSTLVETASQLQAETCASSSSVLIDLSTSDFPSTLEMSKEKIESNLIEFLKSEGHHPDRNEILIKTELTFKLKKEILAKLLCLTGEANGQILWNTTGADDVITCLNGREYRRSYLTQLLKSLERNGTQSSFFTDLMKRRLRNLPETWIRYLNLPDEPNFVKEVIWERQLLRQTSDFLMKED